MWDVYRTPKSDPGLSKPVNIYKVLLLGVFISTFLPGIINILIYTIASYISAEAINFFYESILLDFVSMAVTVSGGYYVYHKIHNAWLLMILVTSNSVMFAYGLSQSYTWSLVFSWEESVKLFNLIAPMLGIVLVRLEKRF